MREFSRKKAHREHMLRNLATSLILYEKVDTTLAKAKEIKSFVERLLARSKGGELNTIRALNAVLFDRNATKKIIDELLPRYKDKKYGFIRSYHLKNRLGDNSPMMRLELVDRKVFVTNTDESATDKPSVEVKEKDKVKAKESGKENAK